MEFDIRNEIIQALKDEIIGPSPNPEFLDPETNQELLLQRVHGAPKARYGAGMLYPQQSVIEEIATDTDEEVASADEDSADVEQKDTEDRDTIHFTGKSETEEEPVGLANQYLPSAMGFTVRLRSKKNSKITLKVKSAYYQKGSGTIPKKELRNGEIVVPTDRDGHQIQSEYWIRRPIEFEKEYDLIETLDGKKSYNETIQKNSTGKDWLVLRIFDRTPKGELGSYQTVTFTLVNALAGSTDQNINSNGLLFQNELKIEAHENDLIEPYRERVVATDTDEEREMNLLYHKKRVFSVGHGCSVRWEKEIGVDGKELVVDGREVVKQVETSTIPVYELPQVAPTQFVTLSMYELSDLGDWEVGKESLQKLITQYEAWINKMEEDVQGKEYDHYREAAELNIKKCKNSLERIKKGKDLLIKADESSDMVRSFRWMNRAMLWQQQRSKSKLRKWRFTGQGQERRLILDESAFEFESLKDFSEKENKGKWRPFQLAFILMNIESIINPNSSEREIVDLIWFPTGGGKTEAYLGLSAFNIFTRRLKGTNEEKREYYGGTSILMRYTLRLLTTQQYERASSLICACDLIRRENKKQRELDLLPCELGEEPISIGLWVGGDSSPNKHSDALRDFNYLKNNLRADYPFVIMKCPCCGSQIGKIENANRNDPKIIGIHCEDGLHGKVFFRCDNRNCEYSEDKLPIHMVDEYMFDSPPTLLLGTVDKFAQLPWKAESGRFFGFRSTNDGGIHDQRICPPELIIQDELHLIAGPLGTMVGLYETLVQELCKNFGRKEYPFTCEEFIAPKIVASSATISRAFEQVQSLYGIKNRDQLNIFPSQGIRFGDTWFSEEKSIYEKDENGKQKYPGRKYVGILASGYPSSQTAIVRAYAAVLQKAKELSLESEESILDYYWTLLGYFNSIRELGGASSLVFGDVVERLGQIHNRELLRKDKRRYINRSKVQELTSRISSSDIPATLKKLEASFRRNNNPSIDVCLATNMVATGVDISRLGLMFIHGQPKTTAEYIQASSRVGRELPSGPGLVITLYSPSKPRDKSQYEQFQGYHSRIYSNVEPTSVTPFSVNAREKALHALMIAYVRHFSGDNMLKRADLTGRFDSLIESVKEIINRRCEIIDPNESEKTQELFEERVNFWRGKGLQHYGDMANYGAMNNEGYFPIMYSTGAEVPLEVKNAGCFPTPMTMRGVDTESVFTITAE